MFGIKTKLTTEFNKYFGSYFRTPEYLFVSPVGYFCNHSCPMCWRMSLTGLEKKQSVHGESKRLTIQEYSEIFKKIPNSIKRVDIYGGGEPLLYPDILELFSIIKQQKLNCKLITNGSLLDKK